MILPDAAFFELLRTVVGKIKTPFSKQVLLHDLEKFLLRNEIQHNIAAFITRQDLRLIAAIAALNEPSPAELESFFAGELNYAELHDQVVNLEERFIVYRFPDKEHKQGISRLSLNPVLKSVLEPYAADKTMLFPSIAADELPPPDPALGVTHNGQAGTFLFDDRILAALLSFIIQNEVFFKYGGGVRQKLVNAAKTLFPGLPLETVTGALQVLGLFFAKEDRLLPDYSRFAAFGRLSRQERMEYFSAAISCYEEASATTELSSWLLRSQVQSFAASIHRFYDSLDSERLYPRTTLRKLVCILEEAQGRGGDALRMNELMRRGPAESAKNKSGDNSEKIINIMERTGMLVAVSGQYWRKTPLRENDSPDTPLIAMDTPSGFVMYPEIAYNDAIELAAVSCVIEAGEADSVVRFELSRESAVAAFDRGISAETLIGLLQRLSHNRVDESLIYSLRDWEKRHGEVALRRGLVLTLAPEQLHLAQTRALARLITETLAPGVYLLPESAEDKAADALKKAGVTIIARRKDAGDKGLDGDLLSSSSFRNFFPALQPGQAKSDSAAAPRPAETASAETGEAAESIGLIDGFHAILNKMRLSGEERDELTARINRRLVLCEAQLKDAVVRYEKLEARGLDYVGKALIAKQAVSMQSPVEIIWPGKQKQEHIFGIPKALEKTEGESVLLIDPSGNGGGDTIRIPLGKISMLRRIKKSIFET